MEFTPTGSGSCWDLFFGLLFAELIGYGKKLSTRSFCSGSILLAGNFVQVNMKHCLSPALDYLLGATKQYVVYGASSRPGYTWGGTRCIPRLVSTSAEPGAGNKRPSCLLGSVIEKASGGTRVV